MRELDINAALTELEQHEAAIRAKQPNPNHEHPSADLIKAINAAFDRADQQQRLDKGRANLVVKTYSTD